ncbi:MAG: outer membrane protein assembly factor BamE, partial [Gammaproteobacteria bacterium]
MPSPTEIPWVYRIDVQQGNVVTQEMLAQLRPGMDKRKVRYIMGTPLVIDTFHQDRWDYIYSYRGGRSWTREQRRVSLYFEDDRLVRVEGDVRPAQGPLKAPTRHQTTKVVVPGEYEEGFLEKMKASVGFGGD